MAQPYSERSRSEQARWLGLPLLGAVMALVAYESVNGLFSRGFRLDLGEQGLPAPREASYLLFYGIVAAVGAGFLATFLVRLASISARVNAALRLLPETRDAPWVAFGSLAAFVIPFTIRSLLLDDAIIVDDESCYRFGAELVASGRLFTTSPPMKLFFDRTFMINDGHLYPMYFMGWPILMAPGVWLGIAGFMNAFYSGLTVPALFFATRRIGGPTAARAVILFYLASPMLMIAAATQMSNTTCFGALAWMLASYLRARDERDGRVWLADAGVAFFFGLAVLIRPPSAIGIGAPILVAWVIAAARGPHELRWKRAVAFLVPAAATAALFFGINKAQNGSYTLISYIREFTYAKENGLRFNNWGAPGLRENIDRLDPHFSHHRSLWTSIGLSFVALYRLSYNLFGWLPSILFVPFSLTARGARLIGATAAAFFVVQYGVTLPGVDIYGPHHYVEVTLPLVIGSGVGAVVVARWVREHVKFDLASVELSPGAVAAALTVFAIVGYIPTRFRALREMAADVNAARELVEANNLQRALVFSPRPFTSYYARCGGGAAHYVYWRPDNDPDLKNPVLWVNHISLEEDRKLAALFPDRTPVVYFFDETCNRRLVLLDRAAPGSIPDGDVDGIGTGIVGLRMRGR